MRQFILKEFLRLYLWQSLGWSSCFAFPSWTNNQKCSESHISPQLYLWQSLGGSSGLAFPSWTNNKKMFRTLNFTSVLCVTVLGWIFRFEGSSILDKQSNNVQEVNFHINSIYLWQSLGGSSGLQDLPSWTNNQNIFRKSHFTSALFVTVLGWIFGCGISILDKQQTVQEVRFTINRDLPFPSNKCSGSEMFHDTNRYSPLVALQRWHFHPGQTTNCSGSHEVSWVFTRYRYWGPSSMNILGHIRYMIDTSIWFIYILFETLYIYI